VVRLRDPTADLDLLPGKGIAAGRVLERFAAQSLEEVAELEHHAAPAFATPMPCGDHGRPRLCHATAHRRGATRRPHASKWGLTPFSSAIFGGERMSTVPNHALRQLRAGKLAIGLGLRQARTVDTAQIAATCGFDWLFIDCEHNSMDPDTAAQIAAASLAV